MKAKTKEDLLREAAPELLAALKVMVLDEKILGFLRNNDPMALRQALDAIRKARWGEGEPEMETFTLSPEQIQRLNKMLHMNINPAYGGELLMPKDQTEHAIVKAGGMEIKITVAEAFKL